MKKNINKIVIILFSIMLYSCSSYKDQIFKGRSGIEKARMNIITDFVNTYKTPRRYLKEREGKPFNVFWIFKEEITKDFYVFSISPEIDENVTLSIKDTLGKIPYSYFPNNFKIKNEKLFIWKDSITPLGKNILNAIHRFNVLDSVDIKRELDILPDSFEDTRVVTIDHKLKSAHYYVCKDNIDKYKKKVTNKAFGYYDLPKLKCNR